MRAVATLMSTPVSAASADIAHLIDPAGPPTRSSCVPCPQSCGHLIAGSEGEPTRNLNLARPQERACDAAEARAGHRGVRRAEIRVVESVVELRLYFETHPLPDHHALLRRDVPFVDAGSAQVRGARRGNSPCEWLLRSELRYIEILIHGVEI